VSGSREKVVQICTDIIAPLVRADGGELFVVSIEPNCVTLHLAGKCAGCPGSNLTSASIIEPAIHAVAPGIRVIVTSGFQVPPGASVVGEPSGATQASGTNVISS
jgi:Fe-S cluster biogenesis protein NfuA